MLSTASASTASAWRRAGRPRSPFALAMALVAARPLSAAAPSAVVPWTTTPAAGHFVVRARAMHAAPRPVFPVSGAAARWPSSSAAAAVPAWAAALMQSRPFHVAAARAASVADGPTSTSASTSLPPLPPAKEETPLERVIREAKADKERELQQQSSDPFLDRATLTAADFNAQAALSEAGKTTSTAVAVPAAPKSLWTKVKEEAQHYWDGTKLFGKELRISTRLLRKVLHGTTLTRRESRQLKRTSSDLIRLVPFLVIILIPFMELLLPVILKLFPNILPSTFESKYQEEEKKRKLLKVRLEVARFLQDTLSDIAISGTAKADQAKEFTAFFTKCRASGEQAPTEAILKMASLFRDEFTLENLSRPQLVSMCRYLNINAFGTDTFLRYHINRHLKKLQRDDRAIVVEGVEALNLAELQAACMSRGVPTAGVSPARLRSDLNQWLDLHIQHQVPGTLLVLSRAFTLGAGIPQNINASLQGTAAALQATLSSLPDQVLNEAQLKIAEAAGSSTYKQKLDVIQQQEELIEDELEQEETQAAAKRLVDEAQAASRKQAKEAAATSDAAAAAAAAAETEAAAAATKDAATVPDAAAVAAAATAAAPAAAAGASAAAAPATLAMPATPAPPPPTSSSDATKTPPTPDQAPPISPEAPLGVADSHHADALSDLSYEEGEDGISEEQLQQLGGVLSAITSYSALDDVKAQLTELKNERLEFQEDVLELKELTQRAPSKLSERVSGRVDKMIARIEDELERYDSEIGSRLYLVRPNDEGKITVAELHEALSIIRNHPEDERIRRIVQRLDADGDGLVAMEEIAVLIDDAQRDGHGEIKALRDIAHSLQTPASSSTPK